jgi:hypothetical protein
MRTKQRHVGVVGGALLVAGILSGVAVAGNPHGTPPGQAKQQSTTSTTAVGVKPSSTTQHNTHAAAGSNNTKLYGNGKTAGQIAQQNGASPTTDLYGPGNSQPHKVLVCSKNGKSHYVDVHALKSHQASSCPASTTAATQSGAATRGNSANAQERVTICHATPPDTAANGYVQITLSASGAYHGHLREHAADIIPPFAYNGVTYSLNWDATGQAIFANGCVVPSSTSSAAGAAIVEQGAAEVVAEAKATVGAVLGAFTAKPQTVGGVKGARKSQSVGGVKGARKTLGRVAGRARAPRAVTGAASFAG